MKLQPHSFADKVVFVGAVAGVLPPVGCTGVEMVANEMEGELAMAGIKEGAKWTPVDFRNPCVSIDFGTTLDGRITSDVDESAEIPFAKTIGNFAGLAGAIPDAIVRGTGLVQQRTGTALDLFSDRSTLGKLTARTNRRSWTTTSSAATPRSTSGSSRPTGTASAACRSARTWPRPRGSR